MIRSQQLHRKKGERDFFRALGTKNCEQTKLFIFLEFVNIFGGVEGAALDKM